MRKEIIRKSFEKCKTGVIYFFSGTGNTAYVVNKYRDLFKEKNIDVDLIPIEKTQEVTTQKKYDFLIIACPVYSWYPPEMVLSFVDRLPETKNKPVFVITTYGASDGDTTGKIVRILEKKNYFVYGTFGYLMPDNVYFIFNKDAPTKAQSKKIIDQATIKINNDFVDVLNNQGKVKRSNYFTRAFCYLIYKGFKLFTKKKKWVVDKDLCTLCGLCEKNCPTKNITIKKAKKEVKFGNDCMFCTRCYNFCPVNAIHYKSIKKTKKFRRYTEKKDQIN